ncbi:hypothetical protein GCG54_00012408 [Colletotrichum gloeosporioides]|uniref:Protein kinase domain-containing protein n=1 Tax=Colletotrichum gloeosporioides TaxID=474922 RepID=A0A8H4CE78_COLGL|nr:uncharacterized protein GCG54_00012408 [Colletotrichum gloeosporioides]KAF3802162.1 hypothetical protein GCG54_00012408 [Colletotrichum gloeosporioides]
MEARDPEDDHGRMDDDKGLTGQEAPPTTDEPARTSRDMARLAEDMAGVGIRDAQEEQNIREDARISAAWLHQNQPATGPRGFEEAFAYYAEKRRQKASEGVPDDTNIPTNVTTPSGSAVPSEVYIPPNVFVAPGVKIPPGSKFPTDIPIVFPSGTTLPPDIPIGLAEDCVRRLNKNISSWAPAPAQPSTDPAGEGQNTETGNPFVNLPQTPPNDESESTQNFIHTRNDDAATAKQDFLQYRPGTTLCLSPHEPPEPYGISHYANPDKLPSKVKMLSKEEEPMSRTELVFHDAHKLQLPLVKPKKAQSTLLPTVVTPSDKKKGKEKIKGKKKDISKSDDPLDGFKVEVEVVRLISGGSEAGCQILRCKVTKAPEPERWTANPKNIDEPSLYGEPLNVGDHVAVKVFDPLFYGDVSDTDKGPWKVTIIADGDLSRENAAYKHLWEAGRTGPPHLAPQYHGSWTFSLGTAYPKFEGQTRRVGAVMIEYIHGKSIEDLCYRNKHYHLVPPTGPIHLDFEKTKQLDLTREIRLKTLKNFMKHTVHQLHAGVEHWWPEPENILISKYENDKPRVVLVDYVSSMIDTKRKVPYELFKGYTKPPHPFGEFSIQKLTNFAGWFPPGWRHGQFDTWVIRRFHSLENCDYTNPKTGCAGTVHEPDSDSETDYAGPSKQKSDNLLDAPVGKSKKFLGSVRKVSSAFRLNQDKDTDGGSGVSGGAMN